MRVRYSGVQLYRDTETEENNERRKKPVYRPEKGTQKRVGPPIHTGKSINSTRLVGQ